MLVKKQNKNKQCWNLFGLFVFSWHMFGKSMMVLLKEYSDISGWLKQLISVTLIHLKSILQWTAMLLSAVDSNAAKDILSCLWFNVGEIRNNTNYIFPLNTSKMHRFTYRFRQNWTVSAEVLLKWALVYESSFWVCKKISICWEKWTLDLKISGYPFNTMQPKL